MSNVQNTVKQIFRKYIKDTFKQDVENLKIYIYGHELQICGGILKYEDELDITLIHQNLSFIGYEYTNHVFLACRCTGSVS